MRPLGNLTQARRGSLTNALIKAECLQRQWNVSEPEPGWAWPADYQCIVTGQESLGSGGGRADTQWSQSPVRTNWHYSYRVTVNPSTACRGKQGKILRFVSDDYCPFFSDVCVLLKKWCLICCGYDNSFVFEINFMPLMSKCIAWSGERAFL